MSNYGPDAYIPMCVNKSRPGLYCLYDETAKRWFKPEHAPCLRAAQ